MALKTCKSGLHRWDDKSEMKSLEKCCNGYVPIQVPVKNAGFMKLALDEGNLDPFRGREGVICATIMVPEHETERIARLRACEPQSLRKMSQSEPN